jgi:hypothetical protein
VQQQGFCQVIQHTLALFSSGRKCFCQWSEALLELAKISLVNGFANSSPLTRTARGSGVTVAFGTAVVATGAAVIVEVA